MRLIDGDALKRRAQEVATEAWKMKLTAKIETTLNQFIDWINDAPTIEPQPHWIPCERELPNDNREVEVTCEVRLCDGRKHRYTCHASYVHRYSIVSTDYCNFEECDEYNEEDDEYYALPGWYERVHNWDDYSFCVVEDSVVAWRELPEPFKEVE